MKEQTEIAEIKSFRDIENFQRFMNKEPHKSEVKINSLANNSQYIPIGSVEKTLDEVYSGLWSTKNFRTTVIANEIVGDIDLEVFHPVAKAWIKRTGSGSTMIQTSKGKPATIDNKIKNTLVKDYPHLKSECIKNAAKSLGVRFGRDLNRDDQQFSYLSEQVSEYTELQQSIMQLLEKVTLTEKERSSIISKVENGNNTVLKSIKKWLEEKL